VVRLIERLMGQWKSILTVNGTKISDPISIKSGIFQGDSLSPLLFITAINPISWYVGQKGPGIILANNRRFNHLLFVDDWKLFAPKESEANTLADKVQTLSRLAGLDLNKRKCAMAAMCKGKLSSRAVRPTPETELLSQFPLLRNSHELTKYLGVLQNGTHKDQANREKIAALMVDRVKQVTKLKGNSQQIISATNGWALGPFKYSIGIVAWSNNQLKRLDLTVRKLLANRNLRGSRSGKKHLYLPRKLGGRGLQSLRVVARASSIRLDNYINKELEWLKATHPTSPTLLRIREMAQQARDKVGGAESARDFIKKLHQKNLAELKPLHRAVENAIASQPGVHAEVSRSWLSKEGLSPALEHTFFNIKEDLVQTRTLLKRWNAAPANSDDRCRFCLEASETLDHILSSCPKLSFIDYKERHDQVARQVAKVILEKFGVPWKYEYWKTPLPKTFPLKRDGKEGVLFWDPKVRTVNKMEHNHPDMIIQLPEGPVAIIELSVCRDLGVVERTQQKEQRYRQLAEDWAQKHGVHPTVLPIVIGTRGVVPKRTLESLETMKRWGFDVSISRLQKTAAIGSVKIVWKTLQSSG
jgi:hypothetical protein